MFDIGISDESLNSYYDMDKEVCNAHANSVRLEGRSEAASPWHPQMMSCLPALLPLQTSPKEGLEVMPFTGGSAPLCHVVNLSKCGWGLMGRKPQ